MHCMRNTETNKGLEMNKKNSDKHAQYFEAILQIRPLREDVVNFVMDMLESRESVKISKTVNQKNGIDLYLTDQKFARGTLATQLKKKFRNGKITITRSLYGQHKLTSRLVYRATILFRIEEESKEDEDN